MNSARKLAGLAVALGLNAAAYWSARLAYADLLSRKDTVSALRQAARLAPGNAAYLARLSDWAGAVRLNPFDSASRIRLALEAEGRGDFAQAERELLKAAAVDRLYEPRWSLANYYFRRGKWGSFWDWASSAAEISPEPPVALYRLCHEATPDCGLIFQRVVACRPRLVTSFLYWLESLNEPPAFDSVLPRAVESAAPGEAKALSACLSRMLRLGQRREALRLWNRMVDRGLLPFGRLDPQRGMSLTNGDFSQPPAGETFNWSLGASEGVIHRWTGKGSMRFEFSGSQPESCDLMSQDIPVLERRRYRLRWNYRTGEFAAGAGPLWLAGEAASDPQPPSETWKQAAFEFETPPGMEILTLRLACRRMPGTTRARGVYWLSEVRLELAGR